MGLIVSRDRVVYGMGLLLGVGLSSADYYEQIVAVGGIYDSELVRFIILL